jgi:MinD superfamily P-loop ATPase
MGLRTMLYRTVNLNEYSIKWKWDIKRMDKDECWIETQCQQVCSFHTPVVNRVKFLMREESKCLCPHNLERIFKEFFIIGHNSMWGQIRPTQESSGLKFFKEVPNLFNKRI